MSYGPDRLKEDMRQFTDSMVDMMMLSPKLESPIENLLFAAVATRVASGMTMLRYIDIGTDAEPPVDLNDDCLRLVPQIDVYYGVVSWRADFVFDVCADSGIWRRLIVECDGHEFHERTKKQAARDRSRDRAVQAAGQRIMRFTGSELWRDPMGCAAQITDWALELES